MMGKKASLLSVMQIVKRLHVLVPVYLLGIITGANVAGGLFDVRGHAADTRRFMQSNVAMCAGSTSQGHISRGPISD